MKILYDRNIPYVHKLFGCNSNQIIMREGRVISCKDLKNVDVLLIRSVTKVNKELLSGSNVKFVGTVTAGIDHIDQNYLKNSGISYASAPGSNAIAVVEYVVAALFWLAKRDGFFLRDKTIGIVGVGNIGGLLNQRLCLLGMNTLLCDPPLEKKCGMNKNWQSLEKLVSDSDILTIHTPLVYTGSHPTWHMIDLDVLDAFSSSCCTLINTARGAVVDNNALLKVLQCGKKINVILDVWESEPNLSLPLLSYVDIGTAHIAGYTLESKIRSIIQIYHAYCDAFNLMRDNSIDLSRLLSSVYCQIAIGEKIDEFLLHQLIGLVYNICEDDILLRDAVGIPGGFDKLRSFHSVTRREWSSLCIRSDLDANNKKILNTLGFRV